MKPRRKGNNNLHQAGLSNESFVEHNDIYHYSALLTKCEVDSMKTVKENNQLLNRVIKFNLCNDREERKCMLVNHQVKL